MSASSMDPETNQAGVNIGISGLSFQVLTLCVFVALSTDYALRYRKNQASCQTPFQRLDRSFKTFLLFLSLAILAIFMRCTYRIYELSDGYTGIAIHQQWVFFGLESL